MQESVQKKKICLSGIQPSGKITLGNYLGAIKNWDTMQKDYDCLYFIADLHSITVRQDPKELRENSLNAYALLLACGVNPNQSIAFFQSHVPAHAELAWVLNCYTPFGELSRMTQFKEKSQKNPDNINAGLFTYPALMAADILLYQSDLVPTGEDQKQHVEIARNIAQRFNNAHSKTFRVPEPYIAKTGARIMSLADPSRKMSKSDENPRAVVALLDQPDAIIKKFKSAVTDSDAEIVYREGKPGINNLLSIYHLITHKAIPAIEREFAGRGYGEFKQAVGETVADYLAPIREDYERYLGDRAFLETTWRAAAQKASHLAQRTLDKVYKKVGFLAL